MATKTKLEKAHRNIKGFNSTRRNLRKYGDNMGVELQKLAVEIGHKVKDLATSALETGAGRAPDPKTGELARSVQLVQRKRSVVVGTEVMHGFYQEFGTVRNPPHPWLGPTVRKVRPAYKAGLDKLHEKAQRGLIEGDD